ncbi:MAG: hypothetical protein ACYTG0_10125 [Planctomycetota bacterium]
MSAVGDRGNPLAHLLGIQRSLRIHAAGTPQTCRLPCDWILARRIGRSLCKASHNDEHPPADPLHLHK